jgi:hypothetical protein
LCLIEITTLSGFRSQQLEALKMALTHRMVMAAALGIAITSRSAAAQHGSSTSLTHTVSVTVPPRVKVQVGALASSTSPKVSVGSLAGAQGLALSVSATRAWVLSIGSAASSSKASSVRWSTAANSGYSRLTAEQVTVASGALSTTPTDSMLFFQNPANVKSESDNAAAQSAVVLTVTAP